MEIEDQAVIAPAVPAPIPPPEMVEDKNNVILVRPPAPPSACLISATGSTSEPPVVILSTAQNDTFKHNTSITISADLPDPANRLASNISQVCPQTFH